MELILIRTAQSANGTFGVLKIGEVPICVTCEDPWENNEKNISCIPSGLYKCKRRISPKFGQHWQVMDVVGRDLVLIHNGNTIDDTEGCILVGHGFGTFPGGGPGITHSVDTLDMLRERLPDEFGLMILDKF